MPWNKSGYGNGNYKEGNGNSFIFSLREDSNFVKLKCLDKTKEVYHNSSYMCSFGEDGGFRVYNNNSSNCSNLGNNGYYELPEGIKQNSQEAYSYLAGEQNFKIKEMEVYRLL